MHAHPVDEAPTLEIDCTELSIDGQLSSGENAKATVSLPHPFTFITMKLFALRDRVDDAEKDYGRHHALDLYTVFSLMSEEEWKVCQRFRKEFADNPFVKEAGDIVRQFFGNNDARGMIRLKEHSYCTTNLQLNEFREALVDLLA